VFNASETLNEIISSISSFTPDFLHNISQILFFLFVICVIVFFLYSILCSGILLAEYFQRRKNNITSREIKHIMMDIKYGDHSLKNIHDIIMESNLSTLHKDALVDVAKYCDMDFDSREAIAQEIVENEELILFKKLEKTEIIAKIAPAIGLMGTLIPLGPGLLALGAGDTQSLSVNLIIAFDTTVLAMASAALTFVVSRVRRRWYMKDIDYLDKIAEIIIKNFNY
jgi:biopolymer transport protein ExbB/TolQ